MKQKMLENCFENLAPVYFAERSVCSLRGAHKANEVQCNAAGTRVDKGSEYIKYSPLEITENVWRLRFEVLPTMHTKMFFLL
jgi:hypothetical protein